MDNFLSVRSHKCLSVELHADKEIQVVLDNGSTHRRNEYWFAKFAGRVQFHFTPTSAGCPNHVEDWHGLLMRNALRRASFVGKDQLCAAIEAFARRTKKHPKHFHWRRRKVECSQLRHTTINLCSQAQA